MRLMLAGLLVASLQVAEAAAPVAVAVGETKVVTVSYGVSAVEVEDASVLDASRKPGGGIVLTGKATGKTRVTLTMVDGDPYELWVHVVAPGSRIYDISGRKAPR